MRVLGERYICLGGVCWSYPTPPGSPTVPCKLSSANQIGRPMAGQQTFYVMVLTENTIPSYIFQESFEDDMFVLRE